MLMVTFIVTIINLIVERHYKKYVLKRRVKDRFELQMRNLQQLIHTDDRPCIEQLRMDMHTFRILCSLLCSMGHLHDTTIICVEEQIAMFLHILVLGTLDYSIPMPQIPQGACVYSQSSLNLSQHNEMTIKTIINYRSRYINLIPGSESFQINFLW